MAVADQSHEVQILHRHKHGEAIAIEAQRQFGSGADNRAYIEASPSYLLTVRL
jgi:hypothetical protein